MKRQTKYARERVKSDELRYEDLVAVKGDAYSPFEDFIERQADAGAARCPHLTKAECLDSLVGVLIGRMAGILSDESIFRDSLGALGGVYKKYLIAKGSLPSQAEVDEVYRREIERREG
ncbi:MAG TPA: hypothetical protein HA282_04800 [Nanoarchaeota archaeon]|nr:hypothetical protein [Candidatus Pacearchaeota archaeon]HIH34620.1 hypothetical protein [Nanoarchaeota archaeon]HIH51385.1 hypothetical protein [Nanoarchaeota archaeon]HIH66501.1 hypothetical protein [Nanoarchaeota archaeon]